MPNRLPCGKPVNVCAPDLPFSTDVSDGGERASRWAVRLGPALNEVGSAIIAAVVELEEALGVKVDVGTPDSLKEQLRDAVLAEAVAL